MKTFLHILALLTCAGTGMAQPLLQSLPPSSTGITFRNDLQETTCHSILQSDYFYNGGGVAIADFDQDGLQDLFFVRNFGANGLYRNLGEMRFEDRSLQAGFDPADTWDTGVAIADVNADGLPDIYLCRQHGFGGGSPANELYINQGDFHFEAQGQSRGIADTLNAAHATFFDYDRDGDLDLFVVNYLSHPIGALPEPCDNTPRRMPETGAVSDRLYRNDQGQFTDVTVAMGIDDYSFGLSASIADLNQDGWPDIYVANDYDEKDLLYLNEEGQGFREVIGDMTDHIPRFSMGSDIADFNNDGLPDILTVDMVSAEHIKSKSNMGAMRPKAFWDMVRFGNHYQYMSNALQLNRGDGTFSEIGQLAGIAQTDWSWGALFADLDNDGWKDIVITNGVRREIRDNDLPAKFQKAFAESPGNMELLDLIPVDSTRSFIFRNRGDLTFEDVSESWGFLHKGWSNGSAYGDLDNDGDLDLVVNNINATAGIFENQSARQSKNTSLHLRNGADLPVVAGTRAWLYGKKGLQYAEAQSSRGFLSASEMCLHFGMENCRNYDSLRVEQPDGQVWIFDVDPKKCQLQLRRKSGQKDSLQMKTAVSHLPLPHIGFEDAGISVDFRHVENEYDDFERQVLLPQKLSQEGPAIAIGDADGDGQDDFFVGGAAGQAGRLYLQSAEGGFEAAPSQPWSHEQNREDVRAVFLDVEGDGDADLYIGRGGNEWAAGSPAYQDRLFLNDGQGQFSSAADLLPERHLPTGAVAACDFDADGDTDIFVGRGHVPGHYPMEPDAHLLVFENGKYRSVQLPGAGMIRAAIWEDLDVDGRPDLIVTGEWMGIHIYYNTLDGEFGGFKPHVLPASTGWWRSLAAADLDGDGDQDLIAGNLGLNTKYQASKESPLVVYGGDFDQDQETDIVLAKAVNGEELPIRGRECSSEQLPEVAERFETYGAFARADVEAIYGRSVLDYADRLAAEELRSGWYEQVNRREYVFHAFPAAAQVAPMQSSLLRDFDDDGFVDMLALGNFYGVEVETVRYDAGRGCLLFGGPDGFETRSDRGLFLDGDFRAVRSLRVGGMDVILLLENNGPMRFYRAIFRP